MEQQDKLAEQQGQIIGLLSTIAQHQLSTIAAAPPTLTTMAEVVSTTHSNNITVYHGTDGSSVAPIIESGNGLTHITVRFLYISIRSDRSFKS